METPDIHPKVQTQTQTPGLKYGFNYILHLRIIIIILFFFSFVRATPAAYGGSQAREQIVAVAGGLHHSHSNARSKPCL